MIVSDITVVPNSEELRSKLFDFSSRYRKSNLIYYNDFAILTTETYDRKFSDLKSGEFKFYMITKGVEYKPWLVSNDFYGDPGYWWIIMEANNIFDIEDFFVGRTIKVPNQINIAGV